MKIIIFIVFTLGAILNIYEYFTEGRRTIDIIAGVVYGILAAFHLEEILTYNKKHKTDSEIVVRDR